MRIDSRSMVALPKVGCVTAGLIPFKSIGAVTFLER